MSALINSVQELVICDPCGQDAEVGGASPCYLDLIEPPCWEESLLNGQVAFSLGGSSGFWSSEARC